MVWAESIPVVKPNLRAENLGHVICRARVPPPTRRTRKQTEGHLPGSKSHYVFTCVCMRVHSFMCVFNVSVPCIRLRVCVCVCVCVRPCI